MPLKPYVKLHEFDDRAAAHAKLDELLKQGVKASCREYQPDPKRPPEKPFQVWEDGDEPPVAPAAPAAAPVDQTPIAQPVDLAKVIENAVARGIAAGRQLALEENAKSAKPSA